MTNTSKMTQVNRTHKARIFEMIFRDKDNLLELYNAVNGTAYTDSGALTITTLEKLFFIMVKKIFRM